MCFLSLGVKGLRRCVHHPYASGPSHDSAKYWNVVHKRCTLSFHNTRVPSMIVCQVCSLRHAETECCFLRTLCASLHPWFGEQLHFNGATPGAVRSMFWLSCYGLSGDVAGFKMQHLLKRITTMLTWMEKVFSSDCNYKAVYHLQASRSLLHSDVHTTLIWWWASPISRTCVPGYKTLRLK